MGVSFGCGNLVLGTQYSPVLSTHVGLSWHTARIDNDAEDDEAYHGKDLDDGEYKLCLAISPDPEKIDRDDDDEEYGHPCSMVSGSRARPEVQRDRSSNDLEWEGYKPGKRVTAKR